MDKLTIKETKTIINIKQIGQQGVKGDDGDRGLSATVNIGTINTVDYTQPATVENVGTENDAILNFNIPRGMPGDSGAEFSNVGTGKGIWKETINSIAKLRSLLSINSIISIGLDDTEESITFDINTRAFNNAVGDNLSSINDQLIYLQGLIETNTNDISAINTAINTINDNITSINNSLSSLTNRITTAETNISNNTSAINTLNSKVLPAGGTAGQVLSKIDGTNYNTQWVTPSSGSSSFNFNNYTRLKRYFPYASGQNPALNLVQDGYSNSSSNYEFNFSNCINPSAVTGKNYYYNYPKRSYKDSTATGTNTSGYACGLILFSSFNMMRYGEIMIKVGLRTANDTSQAQFVGITSSTSLPAQISNILGNANGTFDIPIHIDQSSWYTTLPANIIVLFAY